MAVSRIAFDDGSSLADQHVEGGLEQMLLRDGLAARRDLQQEHGHEVTTAGDMDNRAVDTEASPVFGLRRAQIDAEVLVDRNALILCPIEISIHHDLFGGTTTLPIRVSPFRGSLLTVS